MTIREEYHKTLYQFASLVAKRNESALTDSEAALALSLGQRLVGLRNQITNQSGSAAYEVIGEFNRFSTPAT
jgi:hypothetical protein